MSEGLEKVQRPGGKLIAIRTKTEPRCKICMSPRRIEIEKLLVKRKNREKSEGGELVALPYIMRYAQKEWGLSLTEENLKGHEEKHFGYSQQVENAARQIARQSDVLLQTAVLTEILADLDVDKVLDEVIGRGLRNLREVDGASITVDHLLKAIDSKRKSGTASAIDSLVDAAAFSVTVKLEPIGRVQAPIIDAEIIEEENE